MGGELGQATKAGTAGFSLIELTVVVAIVATLALGVTLTVGRGSSGEGDMARFRAAFEENRALAIEGRQMRGLEFGPKGLVVLAWRMGATGGAWEAQGQARAWRGRVAFAPSPAPPAGEPDLVILPNGRTGAFSVGFGAEGRCESDGWAGLTCG